MHYWISVYDVLFNGLSYQTVKNPDIALKTKIKMLVRPTSDNGVLLYTASAKGSTSPDFMSLSLNDGFVQFK